MDSSISIIIGALLGGTLSFLGSYTVSRLAVKSEQERWLRERKSQLYGTLINGSNDLRNKPEEESKEKFDAFAMNMFQLSMFTQNSGWFKLSDKFFEVENLSNTQGWSSTVTQQAIRALQVEVIALGREDVSGFSTALKLPTAPHMKQK